MSSFRIWELTSYLILTNIDQIIRIHLSGDPTPEESASLRHWLAESEENRRVYHELLRVWQERSSERSLSHPDALAESIWQRAQETPRVKRSFRPAAPRYWAKVAAVILIMFAAVTVYLTQYQTPSPVATLVSPVVKSNPSGQKSKFMLPDGTRVWLNAESTLRFNPAAFDSIRNVALTGEAYFEVAKDPTRRFVVTTGNLRTTAVGTAFNVRAYPNQPTLEVALVEGKVKVDQRGESRLLAAGTALAYDRQTQQTQSYRFALENVVGWKEGTLVFDSDSFAEFISKTERWYGIKFTVSGTPPSNWSLIGAYDNVSLAFLLDDIRFGKDFTYHINENQVSLQF